MPRGAGVSVRGERGGGDAGLPRTAKGQPVALGERQPWPAHAAPAPAPGRPEPGDTLLSVGARRAGEQSRVRPRLLPGSVAQEPFAPVWVAGSPRPELPALRSTPTRLGIERATAESRR